MAGVEFDLHAYHFHMHTARRDFCINDTGYCKNKSVQHIVQMFNLSHLSQVHKLTHYTVRAIIIKSFTLKLDCAVRQIK